MTFSTIDVADRTADMMGFDTQAPDNNVGCSDWLRLAAREVHPMCIVHASLKCIEHVHINHYPSKASLRLAYLR